MIRFAIIASALLASAVASAADNEGRAWMTVPVPRLPADAVEVPRSAICEVSASKRQLAVSRLDAAPAIALDASAAITYVGACAHPTTGRTLYLVRAVFGHGGTGSFSVHSLGPDLYVEHGSLGGFDTYTRSALVLSLPEPPKHVLIIVSIDE